MINNTKASSNSSNRMGCGLLILTILGSVLIVALSFIDLFVTWVNEQSLFETAMSPDFRWVSHGICSGVTLLICGILAMAVKNPKVKKIFQVWSIAAILGVLSIPIKTLFITAQNATAVFQMAVMLLLFSGSMFFGKRQADEIPQPEQKRTPLSGLVVLFGAALCLPWTMWGALGSILDTILEIMVGVMFSWLAVRFIFKHYLDKVQSPDTEFKARSLFLDGFVVAVFLLIMVAALATNGSQQIWVLTVPVAGWLIAMFSFMGRNDKGHGRLNAGIVLAIVVALPLMFFDMDELSAVFTGGTGETLEWAIKAAWVTFLAIITVTVMVLANMRAARKVNLPKKVNTGFIIIGLVGILIIYFIWGQVGFFGENEFVILKNQADLTSLQNIQDVAVRRQKVYETLVSTAETSQKELRARLDNLHIKYTPYYLLDAIKVKGGILVKLWLQNDPTVDRILDNPQLRPLPKAVVLGKGEVTSLPKDPLWNLTMIHADQVHKELGITGAGIIVGQTDSGVDGRHPELADSYRGATSGYDYNWFDPWNGTSFPTDTMGHGTQTLGVVLGKNTGVAPGAQWIGCVNLARNEGDPAYYLDCMQFMLAPFPKGGNPFNDGDPSKGAMIINNSWGCPNVEGCDPKVFLPTVEALRTAGIFMSVAAGNTGYYGCDTITDPPAIYADVFTSGSVNKKGNLSDFSSIGPVIVDGSNRKKPDLLAPGEDILSAFPGGTYSTASGTSFSAPHVTGVVALMWSANPKLIGNIDATSEILRKTTQPYKGSAPMCGDASNAVGSGILDAYKAVQAAIAYK